MIDKMLEECGVFGIYSPYETIDSVGRLTYYGIYSLQHRGQESAGIAVQEHGKLKYHKNIGLVSEVFDDEILSSLDGKAAVGHTRYSTSGSSNVMNAQPLVTQSKLGEIAIVHNGNLINAPIIRDLMEDAGTMFHTTSDSEVILNLISRSSKHGLKKSLLDAMNAIQGAYSLVMLTENSLVAIRDSKGIRPLVMGGLNDMTVVASESCALDAIGAEYIREIEPGEILIVNDNGIESLKQNELTENRPCSFEFIYFSRPDSILNETSVYQSRIDAGRILAKESHIDADIVSGVPDSGVVAAHGYSEISGLPFAMTLIKNKYVGRSFIAPTQELREQTVSVKLNPLKANVNGKRIVLVDDSIVRGTTMNKIVRMLRKAGAKEVHIRIASPPVQYPCYFGMDYPSRDELVGTEGVDRVCRLIEADSLAYLSLEGLRDSLGSGDFCTGCLTGVYPVAPPIDNTKNNL